MVDAGKVTVKVELDASDIPSTLNRTVNSDLKPAMAKAERVVDSSVADMRASLGRIDSGVSGIAVASKLRPELEQAEDVVSSSVATMRAELSNIGLGISAAVGGFATQVGEIGAGAAAAGAAAGAGFVSGFGGPIAALGTKAGPIGLALAATAGIGLLAGKVLADAVLEGMGQLQEQANVAAKLGLEPEQMRSLGVAASEAYAAGFGESVAGNLDAVRAAVQGGILDPDANAADVEKVVAQLNTVAQVTGEEIPAAVRTAQQAVRTGLVDDVTGAFDLITAAQQRGLNVSGDLFDTINEYGTQFRKLGLDGADAFGLIQQAVKGGARDTDKAADALKEFSIRAIDGSKLSTAAYENLGLSAKATTDAFAQGGQTARDTFQLVIDKIGAIEDPAKRAAIQVALFGTQSEDLGNAINSLDLSTAAGEFGEVAGAAQKASDTVSETAAARWEQAKRSIEVAANSVKMSLAEVAGPAMERLSAWIINNRESITNFFIGLGHVAIDAGAFATRGLGEIIKAVGQLGAGLGNVQGAVLKFQAWQADLRGDTETANELRRQSEAAFSFGEGLTAVGDSMANFDATPLHAALDEAAEKARGATGETEAFGAELGALPVDGVDVPITVDTSKADTAMDDFFTKYRELSVSVELGDAAVAGDIAGGLLGAGVDASQYVNRPARDFAQEVMMPFWKEQGFTVGDHEADQYGEHQNGAVDVMVDSIADGNKVLQQALRDPNAYGIIFNNQVYGYGRDKSQPTPYSAGNTGDPTQDHKDHVHIWYKPTDTLPPASGLGRSAGVPLDLSKLTPATPPPGMPQSPTTPTVAPPAAPPAVTVPQQTVAVVPLFTPATGDPITDALQAQLDTVNNQLRASEASKAATEAAQRVADAKADAEAARIARDAALNSTELKTNEEKAKAEEAYQDSLKAVTEAQNAEADLLNERQRTDLQDQITARRNQQTTAKVDFDALPIGDPRRAAAAALGALGAEPQDIQTLIGNAFGNAVAPVGPLAGQAVAAAAAVPLPGPLGYPGTPTAPSTDTDKLLAERNPLVAAQALGIDVPDYTRAGGGPNAQDVSQSAPVVTANGQVSSDTAAMIDRSLTSADAANKARHDQMLAVLNEIKAQLGEKVLGPAVEQAVTAGLQSAASEIGKALGDAAAPVIAEAVKAAIPPAQPAQGGGSPLGGLIPGMASGGGITGGTPGKDSVPAMLMPGEWVLNTSDVARMGGFAGVERVLGGLRSNGGMRYYAAGGNVGSANANQTVGADFFGVSQVPVLGAVVNLLIQVLLQVLGVQIEQRDTLMQLTDEFRGYRGDFKAYDAYGRMYNDTSGLTDRTSSSEETAADERIRILKIVIDALVKYIIEKVIVPIGKAIGNTLISAVGSAAGAAINTQAPGAGGIVSSLITGVGSASLDIGAEIGSVVAQAVISVLVDSIGEALQSYFPGITNGVFGGGVAAAFADPVSMGFATLIGGVGSVLALLTDPIAELFGGASFDSGGLARGVGMMPKATLAPERVLSPAQTASFDRLVDVLASGKTVGRSSTVIHAPISVTGNEGGARIIHDRLLALTS